MAAIEILRANATHTKYLLASNRWSNRQLELLKPTPLPSAPLQQHSLVNAMHGLKDTYAKGMTVIEPDCSNWARMIENNNHR